MQQLQAPMMFGTDHADFACLGAKARSVIPHLFNLSRRVSLAIPTCLAHSHKPIVTPFHVIFLDLALLFACCIRVAQRQFSLLYPSLLLILSMLCFGLGRGPMSARNAENEFLQRSQTVIPFAPYVAYDLHTGDSHLRIMPDQMAYSLLPERPCDSPVNSLRLARQFSALRHPQLLEVPCLNGAEPITLSFPQSHLHKKVESCPLCLQCEITSHRPNFLPVKSMKFALYCMINSCGEYTI